MNIVITPCWTVAQAQRLFSEQQDNEDMAMVDAENKIGLHWVRRWLYLIEQGVPKVTAYDTVAVRSRKSRRTIQSYVRAYQYFGADDFEQYAQVGITYMTAAITRKEPEQFLSEALLHPNTTVDTLLMEFEAADGVDDEPREQPPYPSWGWGINRRLAILPTPERETVRGHLDAIVDIFRKAGIE